MTRVIAVILLYLLFISAAHEFMLICTQQPLASVVGDSKVEGTSLECHINKHGEVK